MPEEVIQVSAVPSPVNVTEAMAMVHAGLGFLAAADATELPCEVQAQCLQDFEQADAMSTAGRAQMLAAFANARGYCADGDYSPKMWLFHRTRVTKGCAAGHVGWARRAAAHPQVVAALGATEISVSWARSICDWSDKLPEACREKADGILLGAARKGMDLWDLTKLAGEMFEKSRPKDPGDDDPGRAFEDRSVRLQTTFGGAGVLTGDLTPECAAVIGTVLDALSAPAGAPRIPAVMSSGITMRWKKRCGGWWRPGWCRTGPVSRPRWWPISRWRTCWSWMRTRCCWISGSPGSGRSGPVPAPPLGDRPATAARGWTAPRPRGSPVMRR